MTDQAVGEWNGVRIATARMVAHLHSQRRALHELESPACLIALFPTNTSRC